MRQISSLLRLLVGFVGVGLLVSSMLPVLVLLFPFRVKRIYVTNFYGTLMGRWVMLCAGVRVRVRGTEHIGPEKPAIYACNHTSTLDAFTTIWLTPKGTVGVAKKEVLYYPFYGQAWWLAGHVFLDRGQTDKAKASLERAAKLIRDEGLHVCILPEGTRSRSGRLLTFKKGFVHLAL
jgi:1-acyl-sn-glycerol-3-phosphate acyltransferase